jgi:hypothetical protein
MSLVTKTQRVHQLPRQLLLREHDPQHAAVLERDALGQGAVLFAESVQIAGDLARVAPQLGEIPLELVDLFYDVDRDDDVVVFELEECAGIVEQDVGVEDVVLAQPRLPGSMERRSPAHLGQAQKA